MFNKKLINTLIIASLSVATLNNIDAVAQDKSGKIVPYGNTGIVPPHLLNKNSQVPKKVEAKAPTVFESRDFNRIFNLIGRKITATSPDLTLEYFEENKKFNQFFVNFNNYKMKHFDTINQWSKSNINPDNQIKTVFYPFGGPDLMHVLNFFPNAREYTLIGLEPASIPPTDKILETKTADLEKDLEFLYSNIAEQINVNFFKTKVMNVKITHNEFKSVTPMFMFYLSRMGYTINKIEFLDSSTYKKLVIKFNRIKLDEEKAVAPNVNNEQTLTYYSLNLDNSGFAKNDNYKSLELDKKYDVTMLKAASYLMWLGDFSSIKNVVLNNSENILMDSSGFPIKNLTNYNINHYGNYVGPIKLFSNRIDEDMLKLFKDSPKEPLPFSYGYSDGGLKTHIIFATKKSK